MKIYIVENNPAPPMAPVKGPLLPLVLAGVVLGATLTFAGIDLAKRLSAPVPGADPSTGIAPPRVEKTGPPPGVDLPSPPAAPGRTTADPDVTPSLDPSAPPVVPVGRSN